MVDLVGLACDLESVHDKALEHQVESHVSRPWLLRHMMGETNFPGLRLDPNDLRYEQLIFRAIGLYESHEVIVPHLLLKLTDAHDPRARAYAARVVGHWGNRILKPLDILERLVNDLDPRVRLEAIVACSYVRNPHAIEVATMALDHPRDKYIDFAERKAVTIVYPDSLI